MLVITGPTGTGKSALGVLLAESLGGEIISADSMQVYRGMDIGTAKPAHEDVRGVPHHMIDCAGPHERYSVARYVEEATRAVYGVLERGKIPIVAGGTGLYIDSLVAGRSFSAESGDFAVRERLGAEYDKIGGEAMLARLYEVDPDRAEILAAADRRRIVRALEVFERTGSTITRHDEETRALPPRFLARTIALNFENRAELYGALDARVDSMIERGLAGEVRALMDSGLTREATSMQAIGYKEIALALAGEISMDEAIESIKRGTRNYAKRQLTWLRRKTGAHWIVWRGRPDFEWARHDSTDFFNSSDIE